MGHLVPNTLLQTGTSSPDRSKPHPTCHFPSLHQACVTPFEPSAQRVPEKARGAQGGHVVNYLNKIHQA